MPHLMRMEPSAPHLDHIPPRNNPLRQIPLHFIDKLSDHAISRAPPILYHLYHPPPSSFCCSMPLCQILFISSSLQSFTLVAAKVLILNFQVVAHSPLSDEP
jgi:hypothetical protein